jgi:hypothetical protein
MAIGLVIYFSYSRRHSLLHLAENAPPASGDAVGSAASSADAGSGDTV